MKIVIDPGHGGDDPGAIFRGVHEKDIVLDVALRLEKMIEASNNYTVAMTRRSDETLFLGARIQRIKNVSPHLIVSIHCNADRDADLPGMPEARGNEIWINPGGTGRPLAMAIATGLAREFPNEPWRGIKENDLAVVAKTHPTPAALVEIAFIDNSTSLNQLKMPDVRAAIAFAIMRGILAIGG